MKYKHILFDLDHTLWDYDANARETLSDLFREYELDKHELFDEQMFHDTFFRINEGLWSDYNQNKVHKDYIRENRFRKIFDELRLPLRYYPEGIDSRYLNACPQKTNKIKHSDEVLTYLQPHFNLHILTNGFNDVQAVKLDKSGLSHYFLNVITSESAKSKKPAPEIFEHTLALIGAERGETLMVGDGLNTDIAGARNYGIDQVYYNPHGEVGEATYNISCLSEIREILPVSVTR